MRAWVIGLLVLLSACSQEAWNERLSTSPERAFAEQMVRAIQAGDMRQLAQASDPETMRDFSPRMLAQIRAFTPDGAAKLRTVNSNTMTSGNGIATFKAFNYELGAGRRWALLQIILHPVGEKIWLAGVYIQSLDHSPTEASAFSFKGKGIIHFFWIIMMAAVAAISVTAFVLILRTRGLKLKWLWAIGSLFGFVSFQLNWATGQWRIWPISMQLLGASGMRYGPLLPWVMSFAPPVVAIIFLVLRGTGKLPIRQKGDRQPETGAP